MIILPAFLVIFLLVGIVASNASVDKTLNLSQKQMLLLSNYVYFENTDDLVNIQDKLNSMKTNGIYNENLISSPASGIKDSEAIEMFKEIEKDKTLCDLTAIASIDTNIRAVAFVNKRCKNIKGAEAVIVYQGTKGLNEPWLDNLEGAYHADTDLQLEAGKFIANVEKKYDVSHVTGHSKGGNLSQYATITHGENVRKCVSFDGQGFSQLFLNKYTKELKAHSSKITSIVSYKEPVHALLTPIASSVKYIKTDEDLNSVASHVSSVLYDKSFFDENGTYKPECLTKPTKTVELISDACYYLVSNVDAKHLQSMSETASPVIGTAMPVLMDASAHEDMSLLKALYTEINFRIRQYNKAVRAEKKLAAALQTTTK